MRSPARPLEQFRALMETDRSLQQNLNQPDDPAVFIARVVDSARVRGISLGAEQIAAAMQANWPISNPAAAEDGDTRLPPRGWLPVRAYWRDQELHVDWTYAGSRRLSEPFFEQSMARCLNKPFNRLFRYATPIGALAGWLRAYPSLPPTGFIFHMSRCGSTLASQMLAAIPRNIVVSEAGPIDAVVRAKSTQPDLSDEQHEAWLRSIVGALGQARSGEERHFFVKLDSWQALALPLFRRAFPGVPWIFLYREPVEIVVSHLRRRGMQMVPGLLGDGFGFDASHEEQPPESYCAQVLARIGEVILREYAPGQARLVNYRQLPAALWSDVLPHFGVPCSERDRAAMARVSRYDAKRPELRFESDTAGKRLAATDQARFAAQQLGGLHARLEALRLGA